MWIVAGVVGVDRNNHLVFGPAHRHHGAARDHCDRRASRDFVHLGTDGTGQDLYLGTGFALHGIQIDVKGRSRLDSDLAVHASVFIHHDYKHPVALCLNQIAGEYRIADVGRGNGLSSPPDGDNTFRVIDAADFCRCKRHCGEGRKNQYYGDCSFFHCDALLG